jgi:diacylglycerol kinase (ATP)
MPDQLDPSRTTYRIVHNPVSGSTAQNARLRRTTERFFEDRGVAVDFVETTHPTHATTLAQEAIDAGCDVVIAMGGDGTMNEVATAVTRSDAVFGLIPGGSGNGLGRHLGLHGPLPRTLQALLTGRVHSIDTGTANGLPFFNVMGIGYDADLSVEFNRLTQRGLWSYLKTGVNFWRNYPPERYVIRQDERQTEINALMIAVANSDQYGYNCYVAPGAKVDDGELNLTAIKPIRAYGFVPLAARLRFGTVRTSPAAQLMAGKTFIIERPSAGIIHTDGEVHQTSARVEVAVQPQSLKILVPA